LEIPAVESSISTTESKDRLVESKLSTIEVLSRELAVAPPPSVLAPPGGSTGRPALLLAAAPPGAGAGAGRHSLPRGSPSHCPWTMDAMR
jgi:hypothetical protein